jgi:long-subunit fatty acid transport protein
MRSVPSLALLLALLCVPQRVLASGLELMPGGTRSVARGGAVIARNEDPMALSHDPAGLAMLTGNQVMLDFDFPIHDMCVDPSGYYGWGVYSEGDSEFGNQLELDDPNRPTVGRTYATTPLGEVCNSGTPVPIPQLAWASRLNEQIGIGAGFTAPIVVTAMQFGGEDGTVQTPYGSRPTPTRYTLIKQEIKFALGPSIGIAYRVIPQISVGVTGQVGMLKVGATAVQNLVSGTQPSTDALVRLEASDYFIPALTFSIHTRPIRPLHLVTAFRWVDDFRGSGEAIYETNTFHRGAVSGPTPYTNPPVQLSEVRVRLPWQLTAAVRYAGYLPGESETEGDPMATERWDVELDAGYTLTGRARNSVSVDQDVTLTTKQIDAPSGSSTVTDLPTFDMDPHQQTAYTVRLGGSYALLPRELALHAGGFYESRGVEPAFADVDTFAFERVGLGLGVVYRIGKWDLRAGYAHIFSETLEVAPPPHQNIENNIPGDPRSGFDKRVGGTFGDDGTRDGGVILDDPDAPNPSSADAVAAKTQESGVATAARPERVTNAGRYTASFNIVSVGAVYHF